MDAVKFMKVKDRMCYSYPCCSDCPLTVQKNKMGVTCSNYVNKYTEEAVTVVEKWLIDHPLKTMADDFFEKYPNAPRGVVPMICVKSLGFPPPDEVCVEESCAECWGREVE